MNRRQLKFFYPQVLLRGDDIRADRVSTPALNAKCREMLAREVSDAILSSDFAFELTEVRDLPDGTGPAQLAWLAFGCLWQNDLQPGPVPLDSPGD